MLSIVARRVCARMTGFQKGSQKSSRRFLSSGRKPPTRIQKLVVEAWDYTPRVVELYGVRPVYMAVTGVCSFCVGTVLFGAETVQKGIARVMVVGVLSGFLAVPVTVLIAFPGIAATALVIGAACSPVAAIIGCGVYVVCTKAVEDVGKLNDNKASTPLNSDA